MDLQYLNDVIVDGADPNPTDRFGQTVLLKSLPVIKLLKYLLLCQIVLREGLQTVCVQQGSFYLVEDLEVVECGADVLRPDSYGVTPLHIAAALDYVEMIHFPLERKGQRSNVCLPLVCVCA